MGVRGIAAALVAGWLAGVPQAAAQTLYKWIDAQGRVQYADRPPKNFKGEVIRIETDAPPAPASPKATPAPAKAGAKAAEQAIEEKGKEEPAAKRRAQRERLSAALERARERLEVARKALAEAGPPAVDERQVVQQHFPRGTQLPVARSNCREVTRDDGTRSMMCPALVPSEAYYSRIAALEEAVKRAEQDLEEAERAYRRGVD